MDQQNNTRMNPASSAPAKAEATRKRGEREDAPQEALPPAKCPKIGTLKRYQFVKPVSPNTARRCVQEITRRQELINKAKGVKPVSPNTRCMQEIMRRRDLTIKPRINPPSNAAEMGESSRTRGERERPADNKVNRERDTGMNPASSAPATKPESSRKRVEREDTPQEALPPPKCPKIDILKRYAGVKPVSPNTARRCVQEITRRQELIKARMKPPSNAPAEIGESSRTRGELRKRREEALPPPKSRVNTNTDDKKMNPPSEAPADDGKSSRTRGKLGKRLEEALPPPKSHVNTDTDDNKNLVSVIKSSPHTPLQFNLHFPAPSWEELKKEIEDVKPNKSGNRALVTHNIERHDILARLHDIYSAMDTMPPEDYQAKVPGAMQTELMFHQRYALAWLQWREALKPHGGILADDMGLGKTITMLSLIASDRETGAEDNDESDSDYDVERPIGSLTKGKTLVVCAASILDQWADELRKHCYPNRVSVCIHHGAKRATRPRRLAYADIVLTTYSIVLMDKKNGVLRFIHWRRIILDEAHTVRNHMSATSRAVCSLLANRRWAVTGTPLQNKDLDLYAMLKFLRCTPFDDITMWRKWIGNKSSGGQERLNTIMRGLMLRRTKLQLQALGQLQELPTKTIHICDVTLTEDEMDIFRKVLVFSKRLFAQFLQQRAQEEAEDVNLPENKDEAEFLDRHKRMFNKLGAKPIKSHEILVLLLRLRQVCCHCGLIVTDYVEEDTDQKQSDAGKKVAARRSSRRLSLSVGKAKPKQRGKLTQKKKKKAPAPSTSRQADDSDSDGATTAAEAIRSVLYLDDPVLQLDNRSSKIEAVMNCLETNVFPNKGEKAVVVSQWTSVLSLVEAELDKMLVKSVTLCGSVPLAKRADLISTLNNPKSDVRIMLLSLGAGGVGLNLCGANHLLLIDPHWNPQLEVQAQDRVYRLGQTKPVHIYRFICVNTVEHNIRALQEKKLKLAEDVLTGAKNDGAKLSLEDLKALFNMGWSSTRS